MNSGVAWWLRRCATSRKVPGSIPGRVIWDFFHVHVPGVDSAIKNEYQDIPGGKGGRCSFMCRVSSTLEEGKEKRKGGEMG